MSLFLSSQNELNSPSASVSFSPPFDLPHLRREPFNNLHCHAIPHQYSPTPPNPSANAPFSPNNLPPQTCALHSTNRHPPFPVRAIAKARSSTLDARRPPARPGLQRLPFGSHTHSGYRVRLRSYFPLTHRIERLASSIQIAVVGKGDGGVAGHSSSGRDENCSGKLKGIYRPSLQRPSLVSVCSSADSLRVSLQYDDPLRLADPRNLTSKNFLLVPSSQPPPHHD